MNCEHVTGILDDQRLDRLDPERRRQAEAHVAVCADCARAWNLQAGLAALPDMALPADLAARCRVAVAAGAAPIGKRDARRIWLVGAVASLAAAAIVLFLLRGPAATLPEATVVQTVKAPAPSHVVETVSLEPVAEITPAVVVEAAPSEPRFTVRLIPYEVPTEAPVAADDPAGWGRELSAMQKRANDSDPSREQSMQLLYAALLDELRKIPGLSLVASDPPDLTPPQKHFRLKMSPVMMLGVDNRPAPINPRYVQVALGVELLQPGGKNVTRMGASGQIDLQANCSGAAPAVNAPSCRDVRGVAVSMVQALIKGIFPPALSVTRPLQAKFRDASLDPAQRLQALDELYKLHARTGDASLLSEPGMVRAAIAMAASADPVLRARIWRSLRGGGNPELIPPMLASLAQDPDDVRLAAIEALAADFPGDPRVRAALEATTQGDARPLVRAVAGRGLTGEAGWRQYVVSSLKDSNVQAPQRVEALVYMLYPPGPTRETTSTSPDYSQAMQELLDDDAVRAFAEAIPNSGGLGAGANNLLGNFAARYNKNPAVVEMLLRELEGDPKPLMRSTAAQTLALTHGDDPKVREALIKALNSDPEQRVRDVIRQSMGNKLP